MSPENFYQHVGVALGKYSKTDISGSFINSNVYASEEYNFHVRCYYGKCKKLRHSMFSREFVKAAGVDFEVFLSL